MTRFILAPPGVNPLEEPIADRKRNTEWLFYAGMALLMLAGGGVSWWWMSSAQAAQAEAARATATMQAQAAASANPAEPTSTITPVPTETFIPTVTPTATGLLDMYFKVRPSHTPVLNGVLTPVPTTTPEPPILDGLLTQVSPPRGGGGDTVIVQVTSVVVHTLVVVTQIVMTQIVMMTTTPMPTYTQPPTQTPWVITATPAPPIVDRPFKLFLPLVTR